LRSGKRESLDGLMLRYHELRAIAHRQLAARRWAKARVLLWRALQS